MKAKHRLFTEDFKNVMLAAFKRLWSASNLFSFSLYVIATIVVITTTNNKSVSDIDNFESGKVADRDIVASIPVSFVDKEATRLRLETILSQVPAVFRFSEESNTNMLDSWNAFCDFSDSFFNRNTSTTEARLEIEAKYPGDFTVETLDTYLSAGNRAAFRYYGVEVLNKIIQKGIFSFHGEDIEHYNSDVAELLRINESGSQRDIVSYEEITTMTNLKEAIGEVVKETEAPVMFKAIAVDLLRPFIRENVFFSYGESEWRIEETRGGTPPVIRSIEQGRKIIRKGFIITETEMEELRAFYLSFPKRDPRNIIGNILMILLVYVLYTILRGRIIIGRELNNSERYMLAILTGSYIIVSVLINSLSFGVEGFPVSLAIPTALFIMILAVFLGTRPAIIMALALPLGAYVAGAFETHSYFIALVSGAAASTVLYNAQNRMSLIKAGLVIAAANCFAVVVVLLVRQADLYEYPVVIFWAAMNGIISGMLTLGFLPPLEHALNAVTPFRLMELSDLNAPVLRKLFTAAPGTYSHSLMVANLAEQACQDIGANALLARVGAYYHDIGKMENPDYFVENQTDHNRHEEIAPRLSATIIRSHVKLGVEKAHNLGLPKDVISIIAEHHGNSVISWFYNKAAEQEEMVNSEDFTYPGNPPRSKESAVVMLADITEAAVRTLIKPTAGKMDKFIQQLFEDKIDHGQLSESDLSFRDLEIIKKVFVRVLAGYYHSRIEYPKQKEERDE
ncbi:MAG: HDIG domain-containing protein [Treponema sp.]|jgi:putative nucleotidyltransferase with HDIG domain|nr:HDIG domain-containing protein [Treponema sp.]